MTDFADFVLGVWVTNHRCAFKHCDATATVLMVEKYHRAALFDSGAGLVCEQHARDCEDRGVRVKLPRGLR